MNLGQTTPWEPDSIAPGRPLGRWTSWAPSGEPSAPATSSTSAERGSGCSACCRGERLGHEPRQSGSRRAGGPARAGAGGRSVLQHQAPPLLHPPIPMWKETRFWHTPLSPAQQGQRPCHGEAPARHRDSHRHPHITVAKAPRAPSRLQAPRPAPRQPSHLTGWQSRSKPCPGHVTCSHTCTLCVPLRGLPTVTGR